MTEKPPFRRCDAAIKHDLEYARSIRENLDDENKKREYDDIIHDLECEIGYEGFKAESILVILFWLICVIILVQLGGF